LNAGDNFPFFYTGNLKLVDNVLTIECPFTVPQTRCSSTRNWKHILKQRGIAEYGY